MVAPLKNHQELGWLGDHFIRLLIALMETCIHMALAATTPGF